MDRRSRRPLHALVACAATACVMVLTLPSTTGPASAAPNGQPGTFAQKDVVNPDRGQYRWGGTSMWGSDLGRLFPSPANAGYGAAQHWPTTSVEYFRFTWAEVQPSRSDVSFARIENVLQAAAARGNTVGIRIMTTDSCCAGAGSARQIMPAWLTSLGVGQWTYTDPHEAPTVVPDWNDARYLAETKRMIGLLGDRFDGDDRIAFVDMIGYGNYGEWHAWPMVQEYPRPEGQTFITDANARALVDANLAAFDETRLLSLIGHRPALDRALTDPTVGLRTDCLGSASGGGSGWETVMSRPAARDRWKTAPFVTEWCTSNYSSAADIPADAAYDFMRADLGRDMYEVGRKQVARWHVSMLSSGNFAHAWNGEVMSTAQWDDFAMANKTSGYRYTVAPQAGQATTAARGGSLPVRVTWTNRGVAPTYDPWQVWFELRRVGTNHAQVFGQSSVDLRTLRADDAGTASAPAIASRHTTDQLAIPTTLEPGTYQLVVQVTAGAMQPAVSKMPPGHYQRLRMNLDTMAHRTDDGGYVMTTVTID